jgi:hypothetical protein
MASITEMKRRLDDAKINAAEHVKNRTKVTEEEIQSLELIRKARKDALKEYRKNKEISVYQPIFKVFETAISIDALKNYKHENVVDLKTHILNALYIYDTSLKPQIHLVMKILDVRYNIQLHEYKLINAELLLEFSYSHLKNISFEILKRNLEYCIEKVRKEEFETFVH